MSDIIRKLASIQKVVKIDSIPNADSIELLTVLGWKVVAKKGDFNEGDFCVFCEIDSILPNKEEFKFLEKNNYRIKTVRLRKQISQGICFPLSILPFKEKEIVVQEGFDVTEILGVTQYVHPEPECRDAKGRFPEFLIKTDEIRLQSCPEILEYHKGKKFEVTEKLDGCSATYYIYNGTFGVCSRNMELKEGNNLWWNMAKKYNIEEKLRSFNKNICAQGEIIGLKCNGNVYDLKDNMFYIFNMFDIEGHRHYTINDIKQIFKGFDIVPHVGYFSIHTPIIEAFESLADGVTDIKPPISREGLVFRYIDDGIKVSFKVISKEYLLKHD